LINLDPAIQNLIVASAIALMAMLGYLLNKIDLIGSIGGVLVALIIWFGGGLESIMALFLFFVTGSLITYQNKDLKLVQSINHENDNKRGLSNVLGNGGMASILSIIAIVFPEHELLIKNLILASIATACSDTFSSELGNRYGRKYYDIISFQESTRGLDGSVSINGFLFGVIGCSLIATTTLFLDNNFKIILIIIVSGFVGNISDSILGATLQQRGFLNNHSVNFIATLIGSVTALILIVFII